MNALTGTRPLFRRPSRFAPVLLALALPFHLGACDGDDEAAPGVAGDSVPVADANADTVPQPNIVGITLANDTPVVDIPSVCGRQGARVHWQWADTTTTITAWLVRFKEGSPFIGGDTLIASHENRPGTPNGAVIDPKLAVDSVFPYVVQVVTDAGDTVGRDPDIVIKDKFMMSTSTNCRDSY